MIARFPERFMWGAATSAHQVEGGNDRNDWWPFEQRPGAISDGSRSADACRHWERFDEDFALAEAEHHNAHRLSIEWSRIEPEQGTIDQTAVRHYHEVFESLRRRRLEPLVTLHHFTNPLWIAESGGWDNRATVDRFADFVRFCAKEYGAQVDWWCTINEPEVFALRGWSEGIWPPGIQDDSRALAVIANQLEAHARAYAMLKEEDTIDADGDGAATMVGFAKHYTVLQPRSVWNPLDRIRAHFSKGVFNRAILQAPATGRIELFLPGAQRIRREVAGLRGSLDWMGINYYTRWLIRGTKVPFYVAPEGATTNDLGWEIFPEGIREALGAAASFGVPLLITENGVADAADTRRPRAIVETLWHVARAIENGLDVRGYFHWSLMDNFEWADGFKGRFGLHAIDFSDPDLKRKSTRSARLYAEIARANGVSKELARSVGFESATA